MRARRAGCNVDMKPSQIKQSLALHDSGVQSISYAAGEGIVRVRVDLCNYAQPGYREGEPELVPGTLEFTGVSRVEAKPELASFAWAEDQLDGEILEVKPLPAPAPTEDGVELVIHTMDYRTRARDILLLRIFGGEVKWTADA